MVPAIPSQYQSQAGAQLLDPLVKNCLFPVLEYSIFPRTHFLFTNEPYNEKEGSLEPQGAAFLLWPFPSTVFFHLLACLLLGFFSLVPTTQMPLCGSL